MLSHDAPPYKHFIIKLFQTLNEDSTGTVTLRPQSWHAAMACSHGEVSCELNGVQCVCVGVGSATGNGTHGPSRPPSRGGNGTKEASLLV